MVTISQQLPVRIFVITDNEGYLNVIFSLLVFNNTCGEMYYEKKKDFPF